MLWLYLTMTLIGASLFVFYIAGVRIVQLEQASPPVTVKVDWSGRTRDRRTAITQSIERWKHVALGAFGSNLLWIPLFILTLKYSLFT